MSIAGSALSPVKTQELQSASQAKADKYLLPMEYTSSSTESQVPAQVAVHLYASTESHCAGVRGQSTIVQERAAHYTDLDMIWRWLWHRFSRAVLGRGTEAHTACDKCK